MKNVNEGIGNIALFPEENPYPVLRVDGEGTLLYANRASADLLTQWHCIVGGVVPEFVREKTSMALESGLHHELEVRCGEREFSLAMVPIDERGYVNFYGRDVTKRKQIEEGLAKSEELLKRAQEIAHLGSWELDLVDNSLVWSDEVYRIFGFKPDEGTVSYDVFLEAIHPEDREEVNGAYLCSIQDGRDSYEIEHRVVQKNTGDILYVHEKCQHIRDGAGKIIRSVGMVHDITSRKKKRMEIERLNAELEVRARELEGLNKELEAFNYTIAHDLRKPLTVISSYCQILEKRLGGKLDQDSVDYLGKITQSTFKMSELIKALLDFSHLAHTELKRERIDLSDVAKLVIADLKLTEPGRKVTFRCPREMSVDADKTLFTAVLVNLLGNAWKFTAEQGEAIIELGMNEQNGKHVFFIRDNGIGFPTESAKDLFVPFQRLQDAGRTTGFGIGLATVERIIHRHRGEIWAEGAPGKGATFYFHF